MCDRTWLLAALLGAGCATPRVDTSADRDRVRELVRESVGDVELERTRDDAARAAELDIALADGLGLDEALRLALARNERLHAGFAALGVARAEFVQAGLLRNPHVGLGFLFPSGGGRPKFSLDLVQSFVDLWELPERRAFAEAAVQQRILELSRKAAELVADTKAAYFASAGGAELNAVARASARLAGEAARAVEQRVAGGVATRIEADLARHQAAVAELARLHSERELGGALRRLGALLSVERDLAGIELVDRLPATVPDLDREAIVARARSTRLDLRAAEASVRTARAELELERARSTPGVDVSGNLERPERGSDIGLLSGVGATVELPLFDRNDAHIARAGFALEKAEREHAALRAEIAQSVRAAVDGLGGVLRSARYVEDELAPRVAESAERARGAFELGNTTVLALLESQRAELDVRRARVQARIDAAEALVELERAAGASLERLLAPGAPE